MRSTRFKLTPAPGCRGNWDCQPHGPCGPSKALTSKMGKVWNQKDILRACSCLVRRWDLGVTPKHSPLHFCSVPFPEGLIFWQWEEPPLPDTLREQSPPPLLLMLFYVRNLRKPLRKTKGVWSSEAACLQRGRCAEVLVCASTDGACLCSSV